jgi:putative oxidoreductase
LDNNEVQRSSFSSPLKEEKVMLRWFKPPVMSAPASVGLLVLRLVVGLAFIYHGYGKIQHPFAWMPEGAPVPGILQAAAAFSEFGGGIAWILGLLTPLASLGLASTMAVATYMHAVKWHHPFIATETDPHSYELATAYFAVALLLLLAGPGCLSIDRALFGERTPKTPTS